MPDELRLKRLSAKLDAERPGDFVARFSTFDVVDHDGEITRRESFTDGQAVVVGAWNHGWSELPSGKGEIRLADDHAEIVGGFFAGQGEGFEETPSGLAMYRTVKNLGDLQEWSYWFRPGKVEYVDSETEEDRMHAVLLDIDVWSVDPVLRGASVDTETLAIKGRTRPEPAGEPKQDEAGRFALAVARARLVLGRTV